ncbi:MAG: SDR family NAD(P)-dependent oxidoreductase [Erythrobacter sp.]|uniref:SDR family oxidoreductase n=1 Tax=Erythrobacter sp. TaxID=1042 RepID=UPI003265D6E4
MNIVGKKVLLTGGSAGIGKALAFQLQAGGADVTVTGRNVQRLAELRTQGFGAIEADLSNAQGVDALIAEWGKKDLDILINNAGMGVETNYAEGKVDPDDADACFYANLSAPARLTGGLLRWLRKRPEASIVFVTSGLALAPSKDAAVYCATKAGLRSFAFSLRAQFKNEPVHVIEALPPMVDTQMTSAYDVSKMSPEHCAGDILDAIKRNKAEVHIGQTRLLRFVQGISPSLARRIMLNL